GGRVVQLALGFLNHDFQLAGQLTLVQCGVDQRVALNVYGLLERAFGGGKDGVIDRLVVDGGGGEVAAEHLGLAREVTGAAPGGSLEEHVLQHVGNAHPFVRLVEVPGANVGDDRDDGGGLVALNENGEAVGEDLAMYAVGPHGRLDGWTVG